MSARRQQIIEEARTWLDTRFQHQGRRKGMAVDCAGLIIGVAHEIGLLSGFDLRDYSMNPDGVTMKATLEAQMMPIKYRDLRPGDVIHLAFEKLPQHVAIITSVKPFYIIHADSQAAGGGRVVENRLDSVWLGRLRGCYRFHGVTD